MSKMPVDPFLPAAPSAKVTNRRVVSSRAVIRSHQALTHDTDKLVIAVVDGEPRITGNAGQFASLSFPGIERPRPYSFASDPELAPVGVLTFFIRRVPGGEVSNWLAAGDRSGSDVTVTGPLGEFGLDQNSTPMVFVGGGSGLSAIMALLEHASAEQIERDCLFLYGARTQRDLYCQREIAQLGDAWHPQRAFEFVPILSEEDNSSDWPGCRGLVTDYLRDQVVGREQRDLTSASAFFCGPPPMVAAGSDLLLKAGVPASQIFRDVFEDARSPAPVIDNQRCVLCDECLLVKPVDDCIVETAGLLRDGHGKVQAYKPVEPGRSAGLYYNTLHINAESCIRCYACVSVCPHGAISPSFINSRTLAEQREAG